MRTDTVPLKNDTKSGFVLLSWDTAIMRLSTERWRFLVLVDHITYPDGSKFTGGMPKLFVHFKNASHLAVAFDVRLGFIASNPLTISKVKANPVRVTREEFGDVSILFHAFNDDCGPKGVQKQKLKRDRFNPNLAVAKENVHQCPAIPTQPTIFRNQSKVDIFTPDPEPDPEPRPRPRIRDEVPIGAADGKNTVFYLKHIPTPPESLQLFVNGLMQQPGTMGAYQLSVATIFFNVGSIPKAGSQIFADYQPPGGERCHER